MKEQFDAWLAPDGPVALVIQEYLEPVTGKGTVFFPPTFAPPEDQKGEKPNYVIDENGVCLVDSVGSQGNRLEPLFKREPYDALIPHITVKAGERKVDLLDAGHRAADAIVRFSRLWPELQECFLAYRDRGDASKLAKIAPTSLVFGAWDSRETQAKIPRLVESTVRAFGTERLTRAAQYRASVEREDVEAAALAAKQLSEFGMLDSPSGRSPGGVIAKEIRRDAVLNLVALRALAGTNAGESRKVQRYVLGLALIAFLAPAEAYLRQGCLLVTCADRIADAKAVKRSGEREPVTVTAEEATKFARTAADDFGVGESRETQFDPAAAKKAADGSKKKGKSK